MGESRGRILAVHLPRFLIQRRLREDASLSHRPVAVVRSQSNAELVVAASRAALVAGVAPGASATQAKALCPGLRLMPDDAPGDLRAIEGLAEALLVASPAVELCGPEGILADASAAPLFEGEEGLVKVVADRCKALGYRAHVVVADTKFGAMALAVHRPRPAVVRGSPREALAELPLSALPAPESLLWAWSAMGIKTLGALAGLPAAGVAARFGSEGALMQRLALGDDPRTLVPFRPAPPLVEAFALEWPAESLQPVLFALKTVLDRLTARLSGRGLALTKLEIQLRLDPTGEARVALPLARPTNSSRLLLDVFRERLADLKVTAPVVGVGVEALETGPAERIQLCVGDRPEVDEALESVLARLRAGLGEEALFSARPLDAHRPEGAYARGPFRPVDRAPAPPRETPRTPKRAFLAKLLQDPAPAASSSSSPAPANGEAAGTAPAAANDAPARGAWKSAERDPLLRPGARPTRLLEQPRPLDVEVASSGKLVAVRIGSRRHAAASVTGPERMQGEWWRLGYARDYYRALVVGLGGCWIYRDAKDGQFYLHGYFD